MPLPSTVTECEDMKVAGLYSIRTMTIVRSTGLGSPFACIDSRRMSNTVSFGGYRAVKTVKALFRILGEFLMNEFEHVARLFDGFDPQTCLLVVSEDYQIHVQCMWLLPLVNVVAEKQSSWGRPAMRQPRRRVERRS